LRKEVLSAPKSFLALASLRHAVRLACLAAASLGGTAAGAAAAAVPAAAALWGAEAAATDRLRHRAAATVDKRMGISFEDSNPPAGADKGRIAPAYNRTDEARMKLA
jgi:hypothetical protein